MYIPDWTRGRPLCGDCLWQPEPPVYPNNRQRAALYCSLWLNKADPPLSIEVMAMEVADFLACPNTP